MRIATAFFVLLILPLVPTASNADWLVTLDGHMTETRGPWEIDGETLIYTNLEGVTVEISLAEIDLEASEETTALRAGKEYVPSKEALAQRQKLESEGIGGRVEEGESPLILYTRWRCGPCKEAEKYLVQLGVKYVVKDEDKKRTEREIRRKAGRNYILPVLDIGGEIVVGFRREDIKRLVEKLQAEESDRPATADHRR